MYVYTAILNQQVWYLRSSMIALPGYQISFIYFTKYQIKTEEIPVYKLDHTFIK